MLRQVALSLARQSQSALVKQASYASAARSAFLIKRVSTPSAASFSTAAARKQEVDVNVSVAESDAPPKKTRAKKTTTATTKKASTKKAASTKKKAPKKKKKAALKKKAEPKKKKPVKKVPPPKPKRVLNPPKKFNNAWVLYYVERLKAMPKEERSTSVADLTKEIVADFRNLSADERQALDDRLAQHKRDYEVKIKEYMSTVTPEMIEQENKYRKSVRAKNAAGKTKRKPSLIKDETKPRVPFNGYLRFVQRIHTEPDFAEDVLGGPITDFTIPEVSKAAGERWKGMSAEEKEPYISAHKAEQAEYVEKMAAWKAKHGKTSS